MSETKQSNAAHNVGMLLLELSMMSTPCHSCINSSITGWRKVLIHLANEVTDICNLKMWLNLCAHKPYFLTSGHMYATYDA